MTALPQAALPLLRPRRAKKVLYGRKQRQDHNGSWGELLPGSFDSVGLALRFVGALGVRTDLETGLMYMRHRWYDATLQRFISRDPIGLEGGANLYAYPLNPSTMIDETGLKQSFTLEMPGKLLLEAGAAIGNQLVKAGSAVLSAARVATPAKLKHCEI